MKKKKENTLANSRVAFNIAKQSPPNNVETTNSIRMFWGHVFVALELVMALTSCSGDAAKTTCDSYRHFTALKNYQLYSWSSEMANPLCDSASVGKMSFISYLYHKFMLGTMTSPAAWAGVSYQFPTFVKIKIGPGLFTASSPSTKSNHCVIFLPF